MIEKLKFIFIESFKTFKRYPLYSFISSLTIMICLLLISLIIYLSNVMNNVSDNFQSNESVIQVFITNSVSEVESQTICNEIKNHNNLIQTITFENKKQLFDKINNLKDLNMAQWFENDIDFMPCLCSASVQISEISEINEIIDKLKNTYGNKLDKIIYPQSYLNKFDKFLSGLFSFIFILGFLIFIVSIFNVSNVIKLNLESRKDVIETLKLHGATKSFIRFPFIIERIIQGLLGSLLSIFIIFLIFNFYSADTYSHFLIKSFITTISFETYLVFNVIFGILLGFIGSNLGVSNHLD